MRDSLSLNIADSEAFPWGDEPYRLHCDEHFGLLTLDWIERNRFILQYEDWEVELRPESGEYDFLRRGNISESYIRERIAVPFLRMLRGAVLLHSGAVQRNGGVIAFLAQSGVGKSTMTAAMIRFAGAKLVSDDVLTIAGKNASGQVIVLPDSSHLAMRHSMFDDAGFVEGTGRVEGKKILRVSPQFCMSESGTLGAIVILENAPHSVVQRLSRIEAVPGILAHQLVMSNAPGAVRVSQFHRIMDWLSAVPCFRMGIQCRSMTELQDNVEILCRECDALRQAPS